MKTPLVVDDVERAVNEIIARVGKSVVIGMPLGLGKPVELVNALYQRAVKDSSLKLKILTALSLEKPTGSTPVEKAFLEPFVERVFGGCPELEYITALRSSTLPDNVEVCEFYFKPGSFLKNAHAQQHYISSNYTHAARDVFAQGCNVVAQMVCKREESGPLRYSLSCNPDTGPELVDLIKASGRPHVWLAQVNQNLPYFGGDAEVAADAFDVVIDHPRYQTRLFSTPKLAVATPDYLIGLHASALIKDGGTLQVGIGALGDAVIYASLLRHRQNAAYISALKSCGALECYAPLLDEAGGTAPFAQGLYGASEMFVDGFMHLYKAGVLKRKVDGKVLHAAFFLGPEDFYQSLRDLSETQRREFCMTGVYKVNQLDHNPALYKEQRCEARFINSGIIVTLAGGVASDGLADGRVISGVGGQYNFVAMAHQLPAGRSIILIRAVRDQDDGSASTSNIVFNYGHITIPRHLRDIVITEYGIAQLRSKTDSEVIQELLKITDSRFQQGLIAQAKKAGKLADDYQIPEDHRHNTPQRLEQMLMASRNSGLFPDYPLGCDFTPQEQVLAKALKGVKAAAARTPKWRLILSALASGDAPTDADPYLQRLKLDEPRGLQDKVVRMLLIKELRAAGVVQ